MKMFAKIKKASIKTLSLFMVLLLIASFAPVVIDAGAEEMPETLPSSVDLTLQTNNKYYLPDVGDQGEHGACAPWAAVYYQYTYEVAKLNNLDVRTGNGVVFSPRYIYNYLNCAYSKEDSKYEDIYKLLMEIGSIPKEEFEYNHPSEIECPEESFCNKWYQGNTLAGSITTLMDAFDTRITSFHKEKFMSRNPSTTVPDITSYDDPDLNLIKRRLADGHILTFATYFNKFKRKEIQDNEYIIVRVGKQLPADHAMAIVGYDDSIWYDFNGNYVAESWEKGAFKIINSHGSDVYCEKDGCIWLAYDALNAVSNYDHIDYQDRTPAIYNNEYYYIDVENHTPQLTVEVTVTTRDRSGFSLALQRYNYRGTIEKTTFLDGSNELAGKLPESDAESTARTRVATDYEGRLGEDAQVGTRVFVFDYSSLAYDDLYDSDNAAVYGLVAEDLDLSYNNGSTVIEKIVWRDSNGNDLKTIMPNDILSDDSETYILGDFTDDIIIAEEEERLTLGSSKEIEIDVINDSATQDRIIWTSSDPTVAVVDEEGVVTAVGTGNAIITATAMDGSGESDSLVVRVDPQPNYHDNGEYVSQDSRRAHFEITLSNKLTNLELHVGARTYTINKTSNNTINTYINDGYIDSVADRVRVKFTPIEGTENVKWDIQIQLSQPTLSGTETVSFNVSDNENLSFVINDNRKYTFWKSSIRTGITEGTTLASIIVPLNEQLGADSQYRYIAVNGVTGEVVFDYDDSGDNNSTIAGTGIIILKVRRVYPEGIPEITYAVNRPCEVIHLLMYGDITGSGTVGDGMIEVDDAMRVLQHYAETDELTDEIFLLAADIDGNGFVTRSDAQAIMDYSGGLTDGAYYQLLHNQNRQVNIYNSIIYNGYTVAFQ